MPSGPWCLVYQVLSVPGSAGLREALTKEIENRSCLRQCLGWLWRLVCGLLTLVSHVSSSLSLSVPVFEECHVTAIPCIWEVSSGRAWITWSWTGAEVPWEETSAIFMSVCISWALDRRALRRTGGAAFTF
ncbi:uncharacterized protein [Desmodus rotundus]|uniref:uncharacterized protein n=1 Tax=Desmodus rotundus TaxID=9430 RepID=UPI0039E4B420